MGLSTVHLFAGAGGGIWADLLLGHTPICAVEIEPYCQRILEQRQHDGVFPPFPIWDDVKTFGVSVWPHDVDLIHAGFPCQPWSVAGKREGEADERNLWPDTLRVVGEIRPRYVFLENSAALVTKPYFRNAILGGLATLGYDAAWTVLGAHEVGAPFYRKRVWVLAADTHRQRELQPEGSEPDHWRWAGNGIAQDAADIEGERCLLPWGSERKEAPRSGFANTTWYDNFPYLGGMVPGLANRRDRVRALGNGQVPLCAVVAFVMLWRTLHAPGEPGPLRR